MKLILPLISMCMLTTLACKRSDISNSDSSDLSSVKIGKFNPPEGMVQWNVMELSITDLSKEGDDASEKYSFANDSFEEAASVVDGQIELELIYGTYKFDLTFFNESELVYQTCANQKDHTLASPEYKTDIYICDANNDFITVITPANLEIQVEIEASEASLTAAASVVSSSYAAYCASCHTNGNNTPIDAALLASTDSYEQRAKSATMIEDGSMPEGTTLGTAEKEAFVKALKCLDEKSYDACNGITASELAAEDEAAEEETVEVTRAPARRL